jgi:hypothetical protein
MKWLVELKGDNYVLDKLSRILKSSELRIKREGKNYVFTSSKLDVLNTLEEVKTEVVKLVKRINGATRVALRINRAIESFKIAQLKGDEKLVKYSSGSAIVKARIRAPIQTRRAGRTIEEINLADWLHISEVDEKVDRVFRLINYDDESWVGLYNILEAIEEDEGDVSKKGWVSKKERRRFRQTACSYDAVGEKARHGNKKVKSPRKPMTLPEAKSLLHKIITNWLGDKIN